VRAALKGKRVYPLAVTRRKAIETRTPGSQADPGTFPGEDLELDVDLDEAEIPWLERRSPRLLVGVHQVRLRILSTLSGD
jgi:hypothetical protein